MATVTIDIDLPPGITITAYQRYGDGNGFEVSWPLPPRCRCDRCGREDQAYLECTDRVQVIRDVDICGQPSFYQVFVVGGTAFEATQGLRIPADFPDGPSNT